MSRIELYCGDSYDIISKSLQNESVDLVFTSPPYWNLIDYDVAGQLGFGQSYEEYKKTLFDILNVALNVLKKNRMFVVNVGDISYHLQLSKNKSYCKTFIYSLQSEIINFFKSKNIPLFRTIIWHKPNSKAQTKGNFNGEIAYPRFIYPQFDIEYILVFYKPDTKKEKIKLKEIIANKKYFDKDLAKKWSFSLWEINSCTCKNHPAIFPEELAYRIIELFTFENEIILDPFMGRGTTLKVAAMLNRSAIGIDLNYEYIKYSLDYFKKPKIINEYSYKLTKEDKKNLKNILRNDQISSIYKINLNYVKEKITNN